ncbi:MAG TPA: hypothetical protein VF077_13245 [Nitrospiraceae bacterium]
MAREADETDADLIRTAEMLYQEIEDLKIKAMNRFRHKQDRLLDSERGGRERMFIFRVALAGLTLKQAIQEWKGGT